MIEKDILIWTETEIRNEIFELQNWIKQEKLKGTNIDNLLDSTVKFEKFEKYYTDEEYGIFILTVLNNFKSKDIINMLVTVIKNKILILE
jgi:hypothetical protein